ncbi:MAG: recombination mediator RecR [Ndongobacter sp.]|nr:recombination mediator RecR [Ndongobacter sp.]
MSEYPESVEALVEEFRKLPTIGRKTAQRLALSVVEMPPERVDQFIWALTQVKERIHRCPVCGNLTDLEQCAICADPRRDDTILCVVEDATNLLAMERGGSFRGRYHVLGGLISPMRDRGPEDIGVDALLERLPKKGDESASRVREVILAISPTLEGETTMLFLAELLHAYDVRVTRIASGIPVGSSLEYYDELTLAKALEDRRSMDE